MRLLGCNAALAVATPLLLLASSTVLNAHRRPRPPVVASNCETYIVEKDATCESIAKSLSDERKKKVSVADLEKWNDKTTWGWDGCNDLKRYQVICISPGTPPTPPVSNAYECGKQSIGNKVCGKNQCCSRWGYCGTTPAFCTPSPPDSNPGTGCQSQCKPPKPPCDAMKKRIGIYQSWSANSKCHKVVPKDLNPALYTQINFAYADVSKDYGIEVSDKDERQQLDDLVKLKQTDKRLSNVKLVVVVGGWVHNNKGTKTCYRFTNLAAKSENRKTFAEEVKKFLDAKRLDGIEVDWSFPGATDRCGRWFDKANYVKLVKALRDELGPRYSISIVVPGGEWYQKGFDLKGLTPFVDYFSVSEFDLAGQWDYDEERGAGKAYGHTNLAFVNQSLDSIQENYDIPASKIVMGVAAFGRPVKLRNPINCKAQQGCDFLKDQVSTTVCTDERETISYYEIQRLEEKGYSGKVDDKQGVTTMRYGARHKENWVAYDAPENMETKVGVGKARCLAGYSLYAADQDSDDFELSQALKDAAEKS